MKHRIALYCFSFFLIGFLLVAADASAQTIAYRQTNLASNLPSVANNVAPGLVNPWGIAFLSDQPFFIADNKAGRVTALDSTGIGVVPAGFIVPNVTGTGFDTPTGIVADQNSFFGGPSLVKPFILVTENPSSWSPSKEQFLLGGRTLKAIFFRQQHRCAGEPALFTRVWRSSTLCSPRRCWRSRISVVDSSRLFFPDSLQWQSLVRLRIRICPRVMRLSGFR